MPMIKVLLILFFIVFINSAYSAEQNLILRICKTDLNFHPFTNLDDSGIWQVKLKKAVKKLPIILDYHEAPRRRCLLEVEHNSKSDAVFAAITTERKKYLSYPADKGESLGEVKFMVYVQKDSKIKWDGKKFENLEDGIVGYQDGFRVMEMLDELKVKKEGVATSEKNFDKLRLGRVSAAILIKEQFYIYKNKHPEVELVELAEPFLKATIYLGVSASFYQKHQKIIDAYWAQIKKVK